MNKQGMVLRAVLGCALFFFGGVANVIGQTTFVPDEVVIKLRHVWDLRQVAKRYGLSPQPIDQSGKRPIYRMRIVNGRTPADVADDLLNDPRSRVMFAEPNYDVGFPESSGNSWTIGGTSGTFVAQWFRDTIRLPQAHAVSQGDGIKIAILDTGIAPGHPQFVDVSTLETTLSTGTRILPRSDRNRPTPDSDTERTSRDWSL